MKLRVLTSADVTTIVSWRYPSEYSIYDVVDPSALARDHWALTEGEELIGYCCFGAPARVAGAEHETGTLDIGYGLEPELMGRGYGHRFVTTILQFALQRYDPERFRLYVLEWNDRSRKVAARHGFAVESALQGDEHRFLVMVRQARDQDRLPIARTPAAWSGRVRSTRARPGSRGGGSSV